LHVTQLESADIAAATTMALCIRKSAYSAKPELSASLAVRQEHMQVSKPLRSSIALMTDCDSRIPASIQFPNAAEVSSSD
jgi:hypothetical protein